MRRLQYGPWPLQLPSEMRKEGFIIDDSCYPWFAYKGPRFNVTDAHSCMTDLEEYLWKQLAKMTRKAGDG